MKLVSLFVVVHVLGGDAPSMEFTPHEFMTPEACRERAVSFKHSMDPVPAVNGRPVIMTTYECVLMDDRSILKQLEELPQ